MPLILLMSLRIFTCTAATLHLIFIAAVDHEIAQYLLRARVLNVLRRVNPDVLYARDTIACFQPPVYPLPLRSLSTPRTTVRERPFYFASMIDDTIARHKLHHKVAHYLGVLLVAVWCLSIPDIIYCCKPWIELSVLWRRTHLDSPVHTHEKRRTWLMRVPVAKDSKAESYSSTISSTTAVSPPKSFCGMLVSSRAGPLWLLYYRYTSRTHISLA